MNYYNHIDYFVHCSSLGFEDRPDYRFLKRNFKDLFERQSYEDDGVYDWDILKKQQEQAPSDGVDRSAADQAIVDQGVDYSPQLGDWSFITYYY
jgi:hypothetical protein